MNVLLALGSVAATLAGLELAIRLYHGRLFELSPLVGAPVDRAATPGARYDPQLGWVPAVGVFTHSPRFTWSTNEASVRNNGPPLPPAPGRPIVTVGDSFTFGDEVMDHETWPAQLEQRLGRRVVNGGVLGYGIDQAFLRGAQFIATYEPDVILLAFISDDVTRAEYSYLSGAKPYFDYVDGVLTLRNVPVPSGVVAMPSSTRLRAAMGYSFLCNAIFRRVATRWWTHTASVRRHRAGGRVTVDLFDRLRALAREHDAEFVAIALATNGRLGDNARIAPVVRQARQRGIHVLDLVPEVERMPPDSQAAMFLPGGHYSPAMNALVATRVAGYLDRLQLPLRQGGS